jgi:hypothetical protein
MNVAEPTQFSAAKQRFTADSLMTSHMVSTEPTSKSPQTSVFLSQIAQTAHAPYLSPPTESNTALDSHKPHQHHQHPGPGIPQPLLAEIPLTSLTQGYFFSRVSVGSSAGNTKKENNAGMESLLGTSGVMDNATRTSNENGVSHDAVHDPTIRRHRGTNDKRGRWQSQINGGYTMERGNGSSSVSSAVAAERGKLGTRYFASHPYSSHDGSDPHVDSLPPVRSNRKRSLEQIDAECGEITGRKYKTTRRKQEQQMEDYEEIRKADGSRRKTEAFRVKNADLDKQLRKIGYQIGPQGPRIPPIQQGGISAVTEYPEPTIALQTNRYQISPAPIVEQYQNGPSQTVVSTNAVAYCNMQSIHQSEGPQPHTQEAFVHPHEVPRQFEAMLANHVAHSSSLAGSLQDGLQQSDNPQFPGQANGTILETNPHLVGPYYDQYHRPR